MTHSTRLPAASPGRTVLAVVLLLALGLAGLTAAQEPPRTAAGRRGGARALVPPPDAALCVAPSPIQATGVSDRPTFGYPFQTGFLHSSISLQGLRARVKWAGGLLHRPPATTGFDGFTSAVVVDNPHTAAMNVTIEYFDHTGVLRGTSVRSIPAQGHHVEAATALTATGGVGSARVTVTSPASHPGLVGAVLTHTRCVLGTLCDTDLPVSTNEQHPGAASMQQLQAVQEESTELWWGPLPLTLTGQADFYNFQAPFLWVVNPNDVPNTIKVSLVLFNHANGNVTPAPWRTVILPPRGTLLEKSGPHLAGSGLWDRFGTWYSSLDLVNNDFDVLVHVTSESGLPILGDGVMTDFQGDEAPRFRMASQMLASTPTWRLINPDFSYAPGEEETLMGVFNVGTQATGLLRVDFFDRDGNPVGGATLPSLPPGNSLRIDSSLPGYPTAVTGQGWARIKAPCNFLNAKLVGWSVHEIGGIRHHKAFGDSLLGTTGAEPGDGFLATGPDGVARTTKVMPLLRVMPEFQFPGYTTFANTSAPNTGSYFFLFHNATGGACTASPVPYAGLRYRNTSTSIEEPDSAGTLACTGNLNGRVAVENPPFEGFKVLGDPFDEYGITGFAPF